GARRIPGPRERPSLHGGEPVHRTRDADLHLRAHLRASHARPGGRPSVSRSAPGPRSRELWRRACRVLVGGVDSPVRSFRAVGGSPVFFAAGRGAYLVDVDRRRYLDLVSSWGANILGNAPPAVV